MKKDLEYIYEEEGLSSDNAGDWGGVDREEKADLASSVTDEI